MEFTTTALNVIIMLAYAVPGFIFVKSRMIDQSHIASFAKVLLYVCSPALSIYSFNSVDFSWQLFANMGLFLLLSLVMQILLLCIMWLIFKKRSHRPEYRVCSVACVLGNVGFFGVPLLEALIPEHPEAIVYSAVYILGMNIISWTAGSMLITGDKKYMSIKKIVCNPPVLALCFSLPLFLLGIKLPDIAENAVSVLGRMSTPLCMLILGMRLATVRAGELIKDTRAYISSAVKLIAFPLAAFLILLALPFDKGFESAFFILCSCPTASVVLNLSEVLGEGQKSAADGVLVSTILCVITIPILMLLA
jgi:predicted permease